MIIYFIPITAACGRPFFVLQTLPNDGFVVGAKRNLKKKPTRNEMKIHSRLYEMSSLHSLKALKEM